METHFPMHQIMQRYHLTDDKNFLYSYEELKRIDIDHRFICTLLKAFENEKSFCAKDYEEFSLEIVMDYIRRTHRYYLTRKLCEIEQTILILLKDYSGNHPLLFILNNFFSEYKSGLTAHIHAEEKQLLPYIDQLTRFDKEEITPAQLLMSKSNYSLQVFIDSHCDTEQDLSNVRKTILQYCPPKTNQTPYRILISQLQHFEKDLSVHALIEDKLLIPRARFLEKKVNTFLSEIVKVN